MRDPRTSSAAARTRLCAAASVTAALLLAAGGCGDDGAGTTAAPVATTTAATTTIPDEGPRIEEAPGQPPGKGANAGNQGEQQEQEGVGGAEPEEADPAASGDEVDAAERRQVSAAEDAYADYVRAINLRDGAKLCSLLQPSFMDELQLPVTRGSCTERLTGSIGFADPRGTPVWKRTVLSGVESALLRKGARVQLSVAIVTEFEGRDQASVESDIAYLEPAGKGYVLAKAPGSLWRAVGKPDVPPSVITPPPGF